MIWMEIGIFAKSGWQVSGGPKLRRSGCFMPGAASTWHSDSCCARLRARIGVWFSRHPRTKPPGRVLGRLMNAMDAIVATSEMSAGLVPWHSVIVPHGIDTDFFSPSESSGESRRVIGYAGRIRHSKGADLFVRSMIRLLPAWPGFTAELAGLCQPRHQEFQAGLQREIAECGLKERIRFLGHTDRKKLRQFYQKLAICVAPSRIEGFGLVPLEAMACGVPVVTSDASSVWPQIVNGRVGRIAKSGEIESFVSAIGNLLADPALGTDMRRAARERILNNCPISNEASELVAVYRRLMGGEKLPKLRVDTDSQKAKAGH